MVSDRFMEAREELKLLYKEILITSYDIWLSRFAQLQGEKMSKSDKELNRVIRARWLRRVLKLILTR